MTDELRADLEVQKMKGASDLFGFELCMHLGRAVAPSEIKQGAYGKPPSSIQGAIDHGKARAPRAVFRSRVASRIVLYDTGHTFL